MITKNANKIVNSFIIFSPKTKTQKFAAGTRYAYITL